MHQTTFKKPSATNYAAIIVILLLGVFTVVAALAVVSFNAMPSSQRQEILGCLKQGIPERHLIPEGYQGWIMVEHGVAGEATLPQQEGVNVFRYADSGKLHTSTPWSPGIKQKSYFFAAEEGPVEIAQRGPNRQIWGNLDVTVRVGKDDPKVTRRSYFFVGSYDEYKKAGPFFEQLGFD